MIAFQLVVTGLTVAFPGMFLGLLTVGSRAWQTAAIAISVLGIAVAIVGLLIGVWTA